MKRSLLLFSGLLATGVVLAQTATPPPSNAQRDEMRQRWHERSEAKFGEADRLARWRWIAHSHFSGRTRKVSGDMTTSGTA